MNIIEKPFRLLKVTLVLPDRIGLIGEILQALIGTGFNLFSMESEAITETTMLLRARIGYEKDSVPTERPFNVLADLVEVALAPIGEIYRVTIEGLERWDEKVVTVAPDISDYNYDVAISFSGEDREYARLLAASLAELKLNVFYDEYERSRLWGKDLFDYLDDVYRKQSRYCILLLSQAYSRSSWANHERKSAQARSLEQFGEYILPIRLDDADIPGVRPTTAYIDAGSNSTAEIARLVNDKVRNNTIRRTRTS